MYILHTLTHTHTLTSTALCCARALTAFTAASHEGFVCAGTINTLKSKNTQCVHVFPKRSSNQANSFPFCSTLIRATQTRRRDDKLSKGRHIVGWRAHTHSLSLSADSYSLFDNTNSVSLQTGCALAHSRLAVFQFSPTLTRC